MQLETTCDFAAFFSPVRCRRVSAFISKGEKIEFSQCGSFCPDNRRKQLNICNPTWAQHTASYHFHSPLFRSAYRAQLTETYSQHLLVFFLDWNVGFLLCRITRKLFRFFVAVSDVSLVTLQPGNGKSMTNLEVAD